MQSGRAGLDEWLMEYELETPRVPEDKMGWVSADDTLSPMKIKFASKESAIAFAEKEGLEYSVDEAHMRKVKPRNYVDNFKYIPFEEA